MVKNVHSKQNLAFMQNEWEIKLPYQRFDIIIGEIIFQEMILDVTNHSVSWNQTTIFFRISFKYSLFFVNWCWN